MSRQVRLSGFLLLVYALLCSFLTCSPPPPCQGEISNQTIDPKGSPCQEKCECNNQRYEGDCVQGVCQSIDRLSCSIPGKAQNCISHLNFCQGIQICKDKGLDDLYWGDCRCPTSREPKEEEGKAETKAEERAVPPQEFAKERDKEFLPESGPEETPPEPEPRPEAEAPPETSPDPLLEKCGRDNDCPEGYVCGDHYCHHCTPNRAYTCPPEMICNWRTFLCNKKICSPCQEDFNCPHPTDRCLSGFSLHPQDRFCIPSCANKKPCPPGSRCTPTTLSNGQKCPSPPCSSQYTCVDGYCVKKDVPLCLPLDEVCLNPCKKITCNSGEACVPQTGKCVTTNKPLCSPCKYKEECGKPGDLCVQFSSGDLYCSQSCKTKKCPPTYLCRTLSTGDKQCIPQGEKCPP